MDIENGYPWVMDTYIFYTRVLIWCVWSNL